MKYTGSNFASVRTPLPLVPQRKGESRNEPTWGKAGLGHEWKEALRLDQAAKQQHERTRPQMKYQKLAYLPNPRQKDLA